MDTWKNVVGYDGLYSVSEYGSIINLRSGKVLNPSDNGIGYLVITLTYGEKKSFLIHRLVAIAFIDNPMNYKTVNHKDGNKRNNHISNLEWCTQKQNILHSINTLGKDHKHTNKDKVGALNWNSKEVIQFNLDGSFVAKYGSSTEAFRETGIDFSSIQKVCLGKRKSAGGFRWEYSV